MIPYNTDAPLYHMPIATVGLIVINTLLFFAVPSSLVEPRLSPQEVVGDEWQEGEPEGAGEAEEAEWNAGDFQIVDEGEAIHRADGTIRQEEVSRSSTASPSCFNGTLSLEYGAGLKPWQWLTSIFMHADFFHLLFNMLALWAFGLVVEGKVGGLVFLAIYLGIGVFQSGVEQTFMMMAGPGVSLGASAAIFGILGIAIVWAPRNDFDVFWSFGFHAGSIEVPILIYGFLQFLFEGVSIALGRFGMSSGLMHLMGMALGIAVGLVWLRRRWVDCEGWDLINVMQGKEASIEPDHQLDAEARQLVRTSIKKRNGSSTTADAAPRQTTSNDAQSAQPIQPTSVRRRKKPSVSESSASSTAAAQALQDVEQLIADGNVAVALKLLAKLKVGDRGPQLSQPALHGLVKGLLAAKHFTVALPFLREHIDRFAEHRVPLQLNLAKLLLHLQRPRKAVEVLRSMQGCVMEARVKQAWQELAAHAQHQIDEGVVEVSD